MKHPEPFQVAAKQVRKAEQELFMPVDLHLLPQSGVREFVEQFANQHHVEYARSGLDDWAEAVTLASGDDVKLDRTGKLLVMLKKRHLINGRQLARLMTNHLKEVNV